MINFRSQIIVLNSNFLMEQNIPQNLKAIIQPILQRVAALEMRNNRLQQEVAKLNSMICANKAPQKTNNPSNMKQLMPTPSVSSVKKADKIDLKSGKSLKTQPTAEKNENSKMPIGNKETQDPVKQQPTAQKVQIQAQKPTQQSSELKTEISQIKNIKSPTLPKKDDKQNNMMPKMGQTKDSKKEELTKKPAVSTPTVSARKTSVTNTKTMPKKQEQVQKTGKTEQMLVKVQQVPAQKEQEQKQNKQNRQNMAQQKMDMKSKNQTQKTMNKVMPAPKTAQAKKQTKPTESKKNVVVQQKEEKKNSKMMKSPSAKTTLRPSIQNKSMMNDESQKENMKSAANIQNDANMQQKKQMTDNSMLNMKKQQFANTNPVSLLSCKDSLDEEMDLMCNQIIELKMENLS